MIGSFEYFLSICNFYVNHTKDYVKYVVQIIILFVFVHVLKCSLHSYV